MSGMERCTAETQWSILARLSVVHVMYWFWLAARPVHKTALLHSPDDLALRMWRKSFLPSVALCWSVRFSIWRVGTTRDTHATEARSMTHLYHTCESALCMRLTFCSGIACRIWRMLGTSFSRTRTWKVVGRVCGERLTGRHAWGDREACMGLVDDQVPCPSDIPRDTQYARSTDHGPGYFKPS
jgi:hypothetical protein